MIDSYLAALSFDQAAPLTRQDTAMRHKNSAGKRLNSIRPNAESTALLLEHFRQHGAW
jgi:hypothetical protein